MFSPILRNSCVLLVKLEIIPVQRLNDILPLSFVINQLLTIFRALFTEDFWKLQKATFWFVTVSLTFYQTPIKMSVRLVRLAIAVNNSLHNRMYNPFLFWEPENMTLKKNEKKWNLIPWYADQFLAVFSYGLLANTYCAFRELIFKGSNTKVNLLNVTFFIFASVTAYTMFTTTQAMIKQSSEIIVGMNALRKYQSKLSQRKLKLSSGVYTSIFTFTFLLIKFFQIISGYPIQAFEVAMENESRSKKNIQHLLGLWLLTSIILSASTILFSVPAVYFHLDPLYYIFQDIAAICYSTSSQQKLLPPSIAAQSVFALLICIRFTLSFWFLFCTSRFYCFLYIFGLLQMQGYKLSLSFLAKLHMATSLFSELRKMRILHSCLYSFCNVLYCMIMLYGQLIILMIWTATRGWNHLPHLVILFLPIFASIIGGWTFSILTIIGNVHKASIEVVKKGRHNIPPKFRGKLLGYQLLKRERLCQFPMAFKCGSLFVISKESGLVFLFKLLENVANSVIIF